MIQERRAVSPRQLSFLLSSAFANVVEVRHHSSVSFRLTEYISIFTRTGGGGRDVIVPVHSSMTVVRRVYYITALQRTPVAMLLTDRPIVY